MRRLLIFSLALLAGCDRGRPAPPAASVAPPSTVRSGVVTGLAEPPRVVGVARPLGDPPAPVAEPANLDRSSAKALLGSVASAIDRRDGAALARCRAPRSERPALDEHDVLRARLDFLSNGIDAHWKRLLARVEPASLAGAERVLARADMGGALGVVTLRLERAPDGWVLR